MISFFRGLVLRREFAVRFFYVVLSPLPFAWICVVPAFFFGREQARFLAIQVSSDPGLGGASLDGGTTFCVCFLVPPVSQGFLLEVFGCVLPCGILPRMAPLEVFFLVPSSRLFMLLTFLPEIGPNAGSFFLDFVFVFGSRTFFFFGVNGHYFLL